MLVLIQSGVFGLVMGWLAWWITGQLKSKNHDSVWHDSLARAGVAFAAFAYSALFYGGDQLRSVLH